MAIDSAILGSLVTTAGGLLMQIISKLKCSYRHTDDGCLPACAFMDGKLERDHDELEVHTVTANDLDMIYVSRKIVNIK